MSSTGRAARRFVASFVFAAAAGLVLIATAQRVESSYEDEAAIVTEQMRPSPEFLAAQAQLEAEIAEEDAAANREASVR